MMNLQDFYDGNVVISESRAYKNANVNGDIIVQADNVTLENLTVNGRILALE